MNHAFKAAPEQRLGEKSTQFIVNAKALDIMTGVYEFAQSEKTDDKEKIVVSPTSWKIKFDGKLWSEPEDPIHIDESDPLEESKEVPVEYTFEKRVVATAQVCVEIHEIEENSKFLVSCRRKAGSNIAFMKTFDALKEKFSEEME